MNYARSRYRSFLSIAWLMGLMLAPHSLALLGNLAGENGLLLWVWLAVGAGIFIVNSTSYRKLAVYGIGPAIETESYRRAFGAMLAIVIPLSGRIITALMAATGLLVTSGFVFNEVFVYWFPNFAFAFLLLGSLLAIQLLGRRTAEKFQILFTGTAFVGLLLLTLIGLFGSPTTDPGNGEPLPAVTLRSVLSVLFLFVGFELLYLNRNRQDSSEASSGGFRDALIGILGISVLFGLWVFVSLNYVQAQRLADTTIAHTLVARGVFGQSGRVVIGIVAIAGTCSAVNALFMAASQMVRQMASRGLLPTAGGLLEKRSVGAAMGLGIVTALMMAGGMAGTEAIDIYLRAGLVFWMLNYVAIHLAVMVLKRQKSGRSSPSDQAGSTLLPVAGAAVMSVGACVLIVTDPEAALMLRFMALSLGVFFVFAFGALKLGQRSRGNTQNVRIETEPKTNKP